MSLESLANCEDRSGFLFKHECFRPASVACDRCGKALCDEHANAADDGGVVCVACLKASHAAVGQRRASDGLDDDPYFYGRRHYDGWGYYGYGQWGHSYHASHHQHRTSTSAADPHDFTEADGESLHEVGDGDFLHDVAAS